MPAGPLGLSWTSTAWAPTAWEALSWSDGAGGGGGELLMGLNWCAPWGCGYKKWWLW